MAGAGEWERNDKEEGGVDERLLYDERDDDRESLSVILSAPVRNRATAKLSTPGIIIIIIAIASSLFVAAFSGFLIGQNAKLNSPNNDCFERTSQKSPIAHDVAIDWSILRFNGSLLKDNVYRQRAGSEVDAAWNQLGINYRSVVVPFDEASRVGLRQDQVKIREEYGGGFPANVEGLHHLHCLNLVRQALYYNIDYYRQRNQGAFANNDYIVEKHVSHCLDIVRQQLMCTVDTGVMGQVWFQPPSAEYPEAYVDFNTQHKCRNFEDIRAWAERNQIPEVIPDDFLQPPVAGDRVYREIP